ncbi:MAG TPA: crotonase/enoyl-CoA hydratase family protein [Acidimicrobiia bacterium]|nr:crotonase/enoyl-CoA hydratase family protein [Acidimicrobiia bacterium]
MNFEHLEVEKTDGIATLWLNRPEKRNALSEDLWADIPRAMADLDADEGVRVVILAARGSAFCVGIDVAMLASLQPAGGSHASQSREIYRIVKRLQRTVSCLADSPKPVIAAVHGYCLGAGLDLITACDIRLASADAVFSVRETKMGLVADVGSLQRLPAIVGAGATTEMAYTGGDFDARWALEKGLINSIHSDAKAVNEEAHKLAASIAANSPLVTQGIKHILAAGEDRTVKEALDYVALWNSSFLLSNDLMEAIAAFAEKRPPRFEGS